MKTMTTISIAALVAVSATALYAESDFDANVLKATAISGPLDFNVEAQMDNDIDSIGLTQVEVGYTAFAYDLGTADATVRLATEFAVDGTDRVAFLGQYNVVSEVNDRVALYGTAEVTYTTNTSFDSGDWTAEPSVGAVYSFNDTFAAYGETGYEVSLDDGFDSRGGYVEIGMPVNVTETVVFTPSVTKTFDTENDATNAEVEVTFNF